jgi:hypothetical protein
MKPTCDISINDNDYLNLLSIIEKNDYAISNFSISIRCRRSRPKYFYMFSHRCSTMFCKSQVSWVLLVSLFIFPSILYNMSLANAQQDNTNFLTYTNTDLDFTIKYPPDWTVDESNVAIRNEVIFAPPDKGAIVGVMINTLTPEEAALINASSSAITNASENQIPSNLSSSAKLLEVDPNSYLLSGHHAIRLIQIQSYGGPGQPYSPQYPEPHNAKIMTYGLLLGTKSYSVLYGISPPEDFSKYLQTAQSMIDSFQIISKQ